MHPAAVLQGWNDLCIIYRVMENKQIVKEIEHIVNLVEDSAKGYRHLAGHLENNELKTVMNRLSQQRKLFRENLENDARDLGGNIEEEGTYKGYFHRKWMDVKSSVSSSEDEARIDEAIRGEKKLIEAYDELLRENKLPDFINERLDEQRTMIRGAISQLEEFERTMVS